MTKHSRLRDLAKQIEDVAKNHICYSQVVNIIRNATDHINALARIEEVNQEPGEKS